MTRLLLRPWTWAKLAASTAALITNAVQLSEVSDAYGAPTGGVSVDEWTARARLVAFEARQLREHVGAVR